MFHSAEQFIKNTLIPRKNLGLRLLLLFWNGYLSRDRGGLFNIRSAHECRLQTNLYIYVFLSSKAGNALPKQELYSLIIFEEKGWTNPTFLIFFRI